METYLQVILSIALLIILFVVGFLVFNYEYLKSLTVGGKIRERVVIFKGIHDTSIGKDIMFDTVDENSSLYRNLTPSYNQTSGIEMTYNFWLYMNPSELYKNKSLPSGSKVDEGITEDNIENQTILFVKGSKRLMEYNKTCDNNVNNDKKIDIFIKCPLVKLEGNGKYLTVEFNTAQNPEAIIAGSVAQRCGNSSGNWEELNSHKLTLKSFDDARFAKKWNMITVVIQDTYPKDAIPFRNKVRCRIYVNTKLELDKYVDGKVRANTDDYSILKPNAGHLYFTPSVSVPDGSTTKYVTLPEKSDLLMIAHLTYFNYVLSPGEIDDEFGKGVGTEFANIVKDPKKYDLATKARLRNFHTLDEYIPREKETN